MEIVINKCYGGFGLSPEGVKHYLQLCGKECYFYKQISSKYTEGENKYQLVTMPEKGYSLTYTLTENKGEEISELPDKCYFYEGNIERTDPNLIQTVKDLGEAANSWAANLQIVDIPDGISYHIDDYDGIESIHEDHRSW